MRIANAALVMASFGFTVWLVPLEALVLKLESPMYVAVRVFVPAVLNVIWQFPAATVAVQLSPAVAHRDISGRRACTRRIHAYRIVDRHRLPDGGRIRCI